MSTRLKFAKIFEDTEAFPLVCHRCVDHKDTRLHSHEFHELVVILSGHGRHITDRGEYPIEAGDVFLVRGNIAHGYADMDKMTLENILFDPRRLELPMAHLRDLPGYHALFRVEPRLRAYDGFKNRLRLTEEELAEVAGTIVRMENELARKKPGYRFQSCAYLMDLIGFLSRCYGHSDRHVDRPLMRMSEVLTYIEQNYRERITTRQLMKKANMSESTLMRTFRRVLSRSPIEHVIRVRILKAAELLERGDVRATEAAFECGFNDSNYFSRQFRQVMGTSPREYRSRHREKAKG